MPTSQLWSPSLLPELTKELGAVLVKVNQQAQRFGTEVPLNQLALSSQENECWEDVKNEWVAWKS